MNASHKKVILIADDNYQHSENIKILHEKDFLAQYVEEHNLHLYCLTVWSKPLRDNVIVEMLHALDSLFENEENTIIIQGDFLKDQEIFDEFVEILKENHIEILDFSKYVHYNHIKMQNLG